MASAFDRHTPRTDTTRPARLRRWVIAIGVIAIVGNSAIDAFNQWRAYRFEVADTGRELVNTARILAAQAEGSLKTVDVLLRDVAAGYPRFAAMTQPGEIKAAIQRGIEATKQGRPALLEFITSKETRVSKL